MATILRKSASSRSSVRYGVARTNEIHINDQGFITEIKVGDKDSFRTTSTIVLGYQGDNNVTLLKFNCFQDVSELLDDYRAVVIFKHEDSNQTTAIPITGNINELEVPSEITQRVGQYQLHYTLQEKLVVDEEGKGHLGDEDEAAFREVFVSDMMTGVVLPSGYNYVGDWSDDDVFDYSLGSVILDDWTYNESETKPYSASFKMAGLDDAKLTEGDNNAINIVGDLNEDGDPNPVFKDKINITFPEDFSGAVEITRNGMELMFLCEEDNTGKEINIIYPVKFEHSTYTGSTVRKPDIIWDWQKGAEESLRAYQEGYEKAHLGMKMDSYVTAFSFKNIMNQLAQTNGQPFEEDWQCYVIFKQKDKIYICPSLKTDDDQLCWVPLGVTHTPGFWEVSLVMKNGRYCLYNAVLTLKVLDSFLERSSFKNETVDVVALYDADGFQLSDVQDAQLYVTEIGDSNVAKLDYSAAQIDQNLDFVAELRNRFTTGEQFIEFLDQFSPEGLDEINDELVNKQTQIDELRSTQADHDSRILNNAEQLRNVVMSLGSLDTRVQNIEDISEELDALDNHVRNTVEPKIQELRDELEADEGTLSIPAIQSAIGQINETNNRQQTTIDQYNSTVLAHSTDIANLYTTKVERTEFEQRVSNIEDDHSHIVNEVGVEIANRHYADNLLDARIKTLEDLNIDSTYATKTSVEEIYSTDGESESGILVEKTSELQGQIDAHDSRVSVLENNYSTISNEVNTHHASINENIDAINNIKTGVTSLPYIPNTLITNIVFVGPQDGKTAEEVFAEMEKDENTLYLVQEEE